MTELQVPWLRRGTGKTPADGGCLLQVLDWIDRMGWSDEAPCVHPVFRPLVIGVNDDLPDDERQRLLDLGPRLMGTNSDDEVLARKLCGWLARQVYPVYREWAQEAGYDDEGAVLACIEAAERGEAATAEARAGAARAAGAAWAAWAAGAAGAAWAAEAAGAARAAEAAKAAKAARAAEAAEAARAARAAEAARAARAGSTLDLLTGLLDHYDDLTRRPAPADLDFSGVCEVMVGVPGDDDE